MSTAVEVSGLGKTYASRSGKSVRAVDGIDFRVDEGELFSLLGPNGAGKTTTISMISGLVTPSQGSISILGIDLAAHPVAARAQIGIVPQEIALYPRLTARQNLEFFGRIYGMRGDSLRSRIDELLDFVELRDRASDRVETFSGGMKRRVNIAAGLIHSPRILYMDEPTVGVDPQSRRRILDLISHLKEEQGIAIIYTTHLMEEAEELSDRVGIIDHGKLIAVGSLDSLVAMVNEDDRVEIELAIGGDRDSFLRGLRTMNGVSAAELESVGDPESGACRVEVLASGGRMLLPQIVEAAGAEGVPVTSVRLEEPNLESVFLSLTGRALRE